MEILVVGCRRQVWDGNLLNKENLAQPIYIGWRGGGDIYWGAVDKVCKDTEYQFKRENL